MPGGDVRRLALDAEQEARRGQDPLEAALDAGLEAAVGSARLVEPEQRLDVRVGHRPAIGRARQRRENLLRARLFGGARPSGRQTNTLRRLGVSPAAGVADTDRRSATMSTAGLPW